MISDLYIGDVYRDQCCLLKLPKYSCMQNEINLGQIVYLKEKIIIPLQKFELFPSYPVCYNKPVNISYTAFFKSKGPWQNFVETSFFVSFQIVLLSHHVSNGCFVSGYTHILFLILGNLLLSFLYISRNTEVPFLHGFVVVVVVLVLLWFSYKPVAILAWYQIIIIIKSLQCKIIRLRVFTL